jgi:hypothetical protein
MKLRVLASASLLGFLLMPVAHAQLLSGLTAKIPFEFRIGDKTHAAGEYIVVQNKVGAQVLAIRNMDRKSGATMFIANPVLTRSTAISHTGKLVFHRYGPTYFLSQVWEANGVGVGHQVIQSKAERTVAHQMASLRKHDTVEIALASFHGHNATD